MSKTFRIAVCNLQTGVGTTRGYWQYLTTGWKYALPHGSAWVERAADFIRTAGVDVAAFCEIGGGARRTRGIDQAALLAEATPLKEHLFFPTFVVGGRINQGNALSARYPVRRIRNHALPGTGEPRFLSEAEVHLDGTPVRCFVTHLSLQLDIRRPQIDRIAEVVDRVEGPVILAGDFNVSEEAELALLSESQLRQVVSAPTFPSWKPSRRLDYLFFSRHFTILEHYAFERFRFSDHLPLVAAVRVDDAP